MWVAGMCGENNHPKEPPMTSLDLVKPWRLIAAIPVLLYAVLLLLELPQSSSWSLLACGVVLIAFAVAARLEYPLLALWPTFVGLFVLSACMCALIEDVVDYYYNAKFPNAARRARIRLRWESAAA